MFKSIGHFFARVVFFVTSTTRFFTWLFFAKKGARRELAVPAPSHAITVDGERIRKDLTRQFGEDKVRDYYYTLYDGQSSNKYDEDHPLRDIHEAYCSAHAIAYEKAYNVYKKGFLDKYGPPSTGKLIRKTLKDNFLGRGMPQPEEELVPGTPGTISNGFGGVVSTGFAGSSAGFKMAFTPSGPVVVGPPDPYDYPAPTPEERAIAKGLIDGTINRQVSADPDTAEKLTEIAEKLLNR